MKRAGTMMAMTAALAGLLCLAPRPAPAQQLISDLSQHLIAISADFSGTRLLVFGAVETEGDIVVVVRGPREEVVVRKKAPVFGIWINTQSATFGSVPGFYGIAATRPLEEVASTETRRLLEIGIDALRLEPENMDDSEFEEFRAALVRTRQAENLFPNEPGRVDVVGERLFRAHIPFPAGVPVGNYVADTFLVRDGEVVAAQSSPLRVSKVGFGAEIYHFAHEEASLYGILAVIAAVMAGLFGNVLFRRH